MRIAISGSTGLIGTELVQFFRKRGDEVTRITRSLSGLPQHERAVIWDPVRGVIDRAALEGHDVVIHLAGEGLFGVWTEGRKKRIRDSRVRGTRLLAETLAGLKQRPRLLVTASGTHYYGDRGEEMLDETSSNGSGFMADLVRDWEGAADPARQAGMRVVHLRFGPALSPRGGLLAIMLPVFRLGLGASVGSGAQYWPWIALDEVPTVVAHVIEHEQLDGPVNVVAPEQVTNAELTDTLAAVVHRPTLFSVPRFLTKVAPGGMGEEMALSSARVVPRKLQESGYTFRQPRLKPALAAMLG